MLYSHIFTRGERRSRMPVFRFDFGDADIDLTVEQRDEIDVNVHVYLHPPEDEEEREALNGIMEGLGGGAGRQEVSGEDDQRSGS